MEYVGIIIILALLQYFYFASAVAGLRQTVGTPATEIPEDATLKRAIRVQVNTHEMLIIFLPLLVLCGYYLDGRIAAIIGIFWLVGRFIYHKGYLKDAKSRFPGFVMSVGVCAVLALGALYGIIRSLLA